MGRDKVFVSAIYAKCNSTERNDLWERLENLSTTIDNTWCVGGDFNIIMESEEKMGENLIEPIKVLTSSPV